jgi:hypothetical protein
VDIEALRSLNRPEQLAMTEHARQRLLERGIAIQDVVRCIDEGEIIRQYEDDKPFPSCLILGPSVDHGPIHIVVSHDGEFIYLITAYYPDIQIWEPDLKTRKELSK